MTAVIRDDILHGGILFLLLTAIYAAFVVMIPYQAALILAVFSLGVAVVGLILYKPILYIYLYLLSFLLYLNNPAGIQITDIIFFVLTLIFAGFFTIPYLITNKAKIENSLDYWYLLFVICLAFGFVNGMIHSTQKHFVISELTYFFGVLLYLPLKENFKNKNFRKYSAVIFAIILLFVLIRNFIDYKEIIVSSIQTWQVEKARVPINELLVLSGAIFSLLGYSMVKSRLVQIPSSVLYVSFLTGLILTQSRGYWIAFIVSLITILLISQNRVKKKIIFFNLFIGIAGILTAFIFFNDIFSLVTQALIHRWDTIGSLDLGSRLGPSLLERVYETKQILSKLLFNPIAGYGLGVTYHRYMILFASYMVTDYIHNGYLGIWFKLGIPGLISILSFHVLAIRKTYFIYKHSNSPKIRITALGIISILTGMLFVNITSPQYYNFVGMIVIISSAAFASALSSQDSSFTRDMSLNKQD